MDYLINLTKEITPPHKHKTHEIIICTKGTAIFHIAEEEFQIAPGVIVITPPETIHFSTDTFDYERIFITGPLDQFFSSKVPTIVLDNSEREGLFFAKTICKNRHSNSEYVTALIYAFAHFLLQNIKIDDDVLLAINNIVKKISDEFYDNCLSPSSLLRKSGYAEDYIRAQFKKVIGKTPTQFLNETRISHACYLIDVYKKSMSLYDISEKCGYVDYAYFSRKFKHITGVSPKKYMDEN